MSSLPGMPGNRGLQSTTDPTTGSGGSDLSLDVPAGSLAFPSPPIIVNQTMITTQVGSIAPTTEGNTLVILTTQQSTTVPYLNSNGIQIGVDSGFIPVYDGICFNYAAMGPRNVADGAGVLTSVPPEASGYVGWEEGTGVYFLESIPGGVTSIRFNLGAPTGGPDPFTDDPFFAFVYELSPSVLDAASDSMIEVDVFAPGPAATTLVSASITTSAPGIAFALVGKREEVGGSAMGGGVTVSWPSDMIGIWGGPNTLFTIYACHLDGVVGTAPLLCSTSATNIGTSKSNFFYGGAIAAFKTLVGVSGGGHRPGTPPPPDVDQFLPNVWINS